MPNGVGSKNIEAKGDLREVKLGGVEEDDAESQVI